MDIANSGPKLKSRKYPTRNSHARDIYTYVFRLSYEVAIPEAREQEEERGVTSFSYL